jgi:hypothetical protein
MAKTKSKRTKCMTCKKEIKVMAQVGTGYCSQNCEDAASPDPSVNHSAGVRPHRSASAPGSTVRRTTTF